MITQTIHHNNTHSLVNKDTWAARDDTLHCWILLLHISDSVCVYVSSWAITSHSYLCLYPLCLPLLLDPPPHLSSSLIHSAVFILLLNSSSSTLAPEFLHFFVNVWLKRLILCKLLLTSPQFSRTDECIFQQQEVSTDTDMAWKSTCWDLKHA